MRWMVRFRTSEARCRNLGAAQLRGYFDSYAKDGAGIQRRETIKPVLRSKHAHNSNHASTPRLVRLPVTLVLALHFSDQAFLSIGFCKSRCRISAASFL